MTYIYNETEKFNNNIELVANIKKEYRYDKPLYEYKVRMHRKIVVDSYAGEKTKDDPTTFLRFESPVCNIEIIRGLAQYFKPIIEFYQYYNPETTRMKLPNFYFMTKRQINTNVDNFLKQNMNKEFTQDLVVELLVKLYSIRKGTIVKNIDEIIKYNVKNHVNNNVPENYIDVMKQYAPMYYNCSNAELLCIMDFYSSNSAHHRKEKLDIETNNILNFYRINRIFTDNTIDENSVIKDINNLPEIIVNDKDFTVNKEFSLTSQLNKSVLPYELKTFMDYINELTVKDFKYVIKILSDNYYSKQTNVKNIIQTFKDLLKFNKPIEYSQQDITGAYNRLVEIGSSDYQKYYSVIYDYLVTIYNKSENVGSADFIIDYCNKVDKVNIKDLDFIITDVIGVSSIEYYHAITIYDVTWTDYFASIILQSLKDTIGSIKTIEMLQEYISVSNKALESTHWFNYIDHYKDYEDLPVAWWVELI